MSETAQPEPTPFEKLKQITRLILAVPKKEIDRRDAEWREQRKAEIGKRKNDSENPAC